MVTTEDLVSVVGRAPHNLGRDLAAWLRAEIDQLGSAGEVVPAAVGGMASDDRNLRVKMLRVLGLYDDPRATAAVVSALSDPARRVRQVAIKVTRPYHLSAAAVQRMRAMVDDDAEIDGLRRDAFYGLTSVAGEDVPDVAREALTEMMDSPRFRLPMLVRLCKSANQGAKSWEVLEAFVDNGTKDEAVMATRALCGHMLVRVDGWLPNDVRRRVRDNYDAAPDTFGVRSCWIPRDEAFALASEVGYPYPP